MADDVPIHAVKSGSLLSKLGFAAGGFVIMAGGVGAAALFASGTEGPDDDPAAVAQAPETTLGPGLPDASRKAPAGRAHSELSAQELRDPWQAIAEFRAAVSESLAAPAAPRPAYVYEPPVPAPTPEVEPQDSSIAMPAPSTDPGLPVAQATSPDPVPEPLPEPEPEPDPDPLMLTAIEILSGDANLREKYTVWDWLGPQLDDAPRGLLRALAGLVERGENIPLEWMFVRRLQELTGEQFGRDAAAWQGFFE